ncbi:MAG: PhzF family phenazine biosynthesis protein [Dehalococcoidia bacterium]
MGQIIYQVDAFTDRAFTGNPAAVCILPEPGDETWMQNIASEINASETAFLHRQDDGFNLRWFSPAVEVDLCGHATLASAHVLWETGGLKSDKQARFHTRSGLLTANLNRDWIELDFPSTPVQSSTTPSELTRALDVTPKYVGGSKFDYLIEVDSAEVVRTLRPDIGLLSLIPTRGFIVTSLADSSEYDFVSRFFAPSAGVSEDPVTGSAHCALGPYWKSKLGKDEFVAYQASARGGVVRVKVEGERVKLSGQAVTVMRGELA